MKFLIKIFALLIIQIFSFMMLLNLFGIKIDANDSFNIKILGLFIVLFLLKIFEVFLQEIIIRLE